MTFRHKKSGVVWIDLEEPTRDEIHAAARELNIGERIEDELINPSPHALVMTHGEGTLLVLHFPTFSGKEILPKDQEIDFVIGKNFVLTVRYEAIESVEEFKKILETNDLLNSRLVLPTDALLEILIIHLLGAIRSEALGIEAQLKRIEHEMFTGETKKTVRTISAVNREFLHLEAVLASQEEPLGQFIEELRDLKLFPPSFAKRGERILTERAHVLRQIRLMRAVATELRETNTDLLNTQQNETMERLTVITFLVLPLSLVANIFEMNVPGVPFSGSPHAFWIIISIMVGMTLTLATLFTLKRWF